MLKPDKRVMKYRVTFVLADDPILHVFGYLTGASAAMLALTMLRRRFYGCKVFVIPVER